MRSLHLVTLVFVLLLPILDCHPHAPTTIRGTCPGKEPELATPGDSCGMPDFVDVDRFGDNADTNGVMTVMPREEGLRLVITLNDLPKPDLVLTAWLIWTPFGVTRPQIFGVANRASPCVPYTAKFGTGLSRDPNTLIYQNSTRARLAVSLNFNPTFDREGPLTREAFCFQKDVPGIESTRARQSATEVGVFIPTSSSYLRQYNPETGFERLDRNGQPKLIRSPVSALGVEIIAHADRTTHGISQGVGGVDHYFVLFFPFTESIGNRTV